MIAPNKQTNANDCDHEQLSPSPSSKQATSLLQQQPQQSPQPDFGTQRTSELLSPAQASDSGFSRTSNLLAPANRSSTPSAASSQANTPSRQRAALANAQPNSQRRKPAPAPNWPEQFGEIRLEPLTRGSQTSGLGTGSQASQQQQQLVRRLAPSAYDTPFEPASVADSDNSPLLDDQRQPGGERCQSGPRQGRASQVSGSRYQQRRSSASASFGGAGLPSGEEEQEAQPAGQASVCCQCCGSNGWPATRKQLEAANKRRAAELLAEMSTDAQTGRLIPAYFTAELLGTFLLVVSTFYLPPLPASGAGGTCRLDMSNWGR